MPTLAIETHNLRKEFGDNVAVRGLTLERGEASSKPLLRDPSRDLFR